MMVTIEKSSLVDIKYVGERIFLLSDNKEVNTKIYLWDKCVIINANVFKLFLSSIEDEQLEDELCFQIDSKILEIIDLTQSIAFEDIDSNVKSVLLDYLERLQRDDLEITYLLNHFYISNPIEDFAF